MPDARFSRLGVDADVEGHQRLEELTEQRPIARCQRTCGTHLEKRAGIDAEQTGGERGSVKWWRGDEPRRRRWLDVGSHAGSGSRIQSRSRVSRYVCTVTFAGLSRSPGVAASRMTSKAAVVAVAAPYAVIHRRSAPKVRMGWPTSAKSRSMTRSR
jgi:hypothetical protein